MKSLFKELKEKLISGLKIWNQFWFLPKGTFTASLFRCLVTFFIFVFYFSRVLEFELYFGESGILPYSALDGIVPQFFKTIFPVYPSHEGLLFSYHILFLCLLILMILGLGGRVIALLAFCLHMMFFHRNYMILYGVDFISSIALFMCIFLKTDNYFSVLNFLKKKKQVPLGEKDLKGDLLHSVGCRLLQLQIMSVYAYSGMEKLRGATWWQGDAIWNTLANGQLAKINFSFLAHFPIVLVFLTFFTVLWELYFPILVWIPRIKYWILGLGVVFHLAIGFMINIPYFSILMVLSYLIYLDYNRDFKRWLESTSVTS